MESRDEKLLSDLENMDMILGSNHYETKDSNFGNSTRRPESPRYDALIDHNSYFHSNSRKNEIRGFAENGQNSGENDSSSELNRLSGELNQRFTQKTNGLMNSVSLQIQRAVTEAINEHVLPQIQASLKSGNGLLPQKG